MRSALGLIMLPLLLSPAHGGQFDDSLPPARYDYDRPGITVRVMPVEEATKLCKEMGAPAAKGTYLNGCTYLGDGVSPCEIILSRSLPYMQNKAFRHERGHCNGWPGDHPR